MTGPAASRASFKQMEDGSLGRSSGPQRPSVTPTNVYVLTGHYVVCIFECVELGVRVDFVTQATM